MILRPWLIVAVAGSLALAPAVAQETIGTPRETAAPNTKPTLPAPAHCAPVPERVIPNNKYYLVEEQAATTITTLKPREVEVARKKETTLEVEFKKQTITVTELESKKRPVVQEVTWYKTEAVPSVDPHTGCACTIYKQVPVKEKVTIMVEELVPVQRQYVVETAVLKPVERDVVVKKMVVDEVTVPAIRKSLRLVEHPGEIRVPLPALAPCLPPGCLP